MLDCSRVGATAESALRQSERVPDDCRLVLVEIGGNDVLGRTTPAEFERHLDALLTALARPGRTVLMMEVPVPPGYARFGIAQRRLARRHRVTLIPKRVLIGVLTSPGATTDSVHLSAAGHELMATMVANLPGIRGR